VDDDRYPLPVHQVGALPQLPLRISPPQQYHLSEEMMAKNSGSLLLKTLPLFFTISIP
jgi:hypothetical protein